MSYGQCVYWTCGWTQWTCPMETMKVHCVHSELSVFVGCVHFGNWAQWTSIVPIGHIHRVHSQ